MQSYTIHPPAPGKGDAAEATLVVDGWSWPAFIFGPLWLAWHRQWLGLLGYAVLWSGMAYLGARFGLPPMVSSLLSTLLNIGVALEGGQIRRWSLARSGSPASGVVTGRDMLEAEAKYITGLARSQASVASVAQSAMRTPAAVAWPAMPQTQQGGDVIGLFPEKGGR